MKVGKLQPEDKGNILLCLQCDSEYSANPNDYWDRYPHEELVCCDEPLTLVTKETTFKTVER